MTAVQWAPNIADPAMAARDAQDLAAASDPARVQHLVEAMRALLRGEAEADILMATGILTGVTWEFVHGPRTQDVVGMMSIVIQAGWAVSSATQRQGGAS